MLGGASSSEPSVVPVQNKPWEWTEYLGEAATTDATNEIADARFGEQQPLIRNSTSLSLELFDARVIGKLVQVDGDSALQDPRIEGNLRMLQDDFLAESVFKRDFRETRIDPAVLDAKLAIARAADHDGESGAGGAAPSGSERHSNSRLASPVGSTRSRGSMQPPSLPSGSRRTSPVILHNPQQAHSSLSRLSGSSAGEPIDVDSLDVPPSTAVKRKSADADDDDVQIVEGPAGESREKRMKGKAKSDRRR